MEILLLKDIGKYFIVLLLKYLYNILSKKITIKDNNKNERSNNVFSMDIFA